MPNVPHKHPDARAHEIEAEVQRLREIERVFNEGWLPALSAEPASLRLRSLYRLRELIPEALEAGEQGAGQP